MLGIALRQAEAFEINEGAYALRANASIQARNVAAHAVADQMHRRLRRIVVEDGIEDGRKAMEEMIKGYQTNPAPARSVMEAAVPPREPASTSPVGLPLNEVGIMAAMEAKRRGNPTEH